MTFSNGFVSDWGTEPPKHNKCFLLSHEPQPEKRFHFADFLSILSGQSKANQKKGHEGLNQQFLLSFYISLKTKR